MNKIKNKLNLIPVFALMLCGCLNATFNPRETGDQEALQQFLTNPPQGNSTFSMTLNTDLNNPQVRGIDQLSALWTLLTKDCDVNVSHIYNLSVTNPQGQNTVLVANGHIQIDNINLLQARGRPTPGLGAPTDPMDGGASSSSGGGRGAAAAAAGPSADRGSKVLDDLLAQHEELVNVAENLSQNIETEIALLLSNLPDINIPIIPVLVPSHPDFKDIMNLMQGFTANDLIDSIRTGLKGNVTPTELGSTITTLQSNLHILQNILGNAQTVVNLHAQLQTVNILIDEVLSQDSESSTTQPESPRSDDQDGTESSSSGSHGAAAASGSHKA